MRVVTAPEIAAVLDDPSLVESLRGAVRAPGRGVYNQIAPLKSVGTAITELAAAKLAFERS